MFVVSLHVILNHHTIVHCTITAISSLFLPPPYITYNKPVTNTRKYCWNLIENVISSIFCICFNHQHLRKSTIVNVRYYIYHEHYQLNQLNNWIYTVVSLVYLIKSTLSFLPCVKNQKHHPFPSPLSPLQ